MRQGDVTFGRTARAEGEWSSARHPHKGLNFHKKEGNSVRKGHKRGGEPRRTEHGSKMKKEQDRTKRWGRKGKERGGVQKKIPRGFNKVQRHRDREEKRNPLNRRAE